MKQFGNTSVHNASAFSCLFILQLLAVWLNITHAFFIILSSEMEDSLWTSPSVLPKYKNRHFTWPSNNHSQTLSKIIPNISIATTDHTDGLKMFEMSLSIKPIPSIRRMPFCIATQNSITTLG
jgi:hypothetical protein